MNETAIIVLGAIVGGLLVSFFLNKWGQELEVPAADELFETLETHRLTDNLIQEMDKLMDTYYLTGVPPTRDEINQVMEAHRE